MVSKKQRKKILNEVTEQLKKFGERLTFNDILAISIGGWAAYATKQPIHFITGSLAYKLATTPGGGGMLGSPSQWAGLITLAALGIATIPQHVIEELYEETLPERPEWYPDLPKALGLPRFR